MPEFNDQISEQEAIDLYDSEVWKSLTYRQRAEFQIYTRRLCMPFDVFCDAVEKTLGRPVFDIEFGLNLEGLRRELRGEQAAPSFQEIMDMIPAENRFVAWCGPDKGERS